MKDNKFENTVLENRYIEEQNDNITLPVQEFSQNAYSSVIEYNSAQGIVGIWLRESDGAWFTFKANGTVERSPIWNSTSGTYEAFKDGLLEFNWDPDGLQGYSWDLSNDGEILTLSIGGGGSAFRRVRPEENIVLQSNDTMGYIAKPDNHVYQRILPNYQGFWNSKNPYGDEMHYGLRKATDFLDYYPDRLDILRNEVYARFGRPFLNQKYKEYFSAQSWYREVSDFSDDWLSRQDRYNVEIILTIERGGPCYDAIVEARRDGVVYTGLHNIHFPLFTANSAAVGGTNLIGEYYISFQDWNWIVMGNWIIIYEQLTGWYDNGNYQAQSFLIDPITKRQIDYQHSQIERNMFERFLARQRSIKEQYTKNW
jgi:hypothetical protein